MCTSFHSKSSIGLSLLIINATVDVHVHCIHVHCTRTCTCTYKSHQVYRLICGNAYSNLSYPFSLRNYGTLIVRLVFTCTSMNNSLTLCMYIYIVAHSFQECTVYMYSVVRMTQLIYFFAGGLFSVEFHVPCCLAGD